MQSTPEDIQLDAQQQQAIAELAKKSNKSWQEVLQDLIENGLPTNGQHTTHSEANAPRVPGNGKGKVWMAPDFDEPLEEFKDYE